MPDRPTEDVLRSRDAVFDENEAVVVGLDVGATERNEVALSIVVYTPGSDERPKTATVWLDAIGAAQYGERTTAAARRSLEMEETGDGEG